MSGAADVRFTGNLASDPEMRVTPTGLSVTGFSVAVSECVKDAAGNWGDGPVTFFRCTAWRGLAENIAASLRKGQRVTVAGTIASRAWTDKEGAERISWEVQATDVAASLAFAEVEVKRPLRAVTNGFGEPDKQPVETVEAPVLAATASDQPPF